MTDKENLMEFIDGSFVHFFVTILVIVNACVIGLKTFFAAGHKIYDVLTFVENFILCLFIMEIGLRAWAYKQEYYKDPWNIFDFFVIFISIIPFFNHIGVIRSFRILRLFYLIEISKKLRHILYGLYLSLPGIFSVLLLMIIFFYVFAVIGVGLFDHPNVDKFRNLDAALHTLFQVLTGDDWHKVMRGVLDEHPNAWMYFYSYYICMSFVILNLFGAMLVGALRNAEQSLDADSPDHYKPSQDELYAELASLKESVNRLCNVVEKTRSRL